MKSGFAKLRGFFRMLLSRNDSYFGVLRNPALEVASVARYRIDVFVVMSWLIVLIALCLTAPLK